MQITHAIFNVNLYFLVIYKHTLQDIKHIDDMSCFEVNLTARFLTEGSLINKMLIKIK